MRKIGIVFLILLSFYILGCSNDKMVNHDTTPLINEDYIFSKVMDVVTNENMYLSDSITIRRMNDKMVLIESIGGRPYNGLDSRYLLVDLVKREVEEILWETDYMIEDVTFEEGYIYFHYTGKSALTGFSFFPFYKVYSITEKSFTEHSAFKSLNIGADLGGYVNDIDLDTITMLDQGLTVSFKANEDTLLAGGEVFPRIKTFVEHDNIFIVELSNVQVLSTFQDEMVSLRSDYLGEYSFVQNIEIQSYIDALGSRHAVLLLTLDPSIGEYNCELPIINGERHLQITFR